MDKNIVFIDWDGTLCWGKFWESLLHKDVALTKAVTNFFSFEKEMVDNWMHGKLSSEQIVKFISNRSGLSEEILWKTFVADCQKMHVEPEVISLIKKLKEKHIAILVTGNMDCFSRFTVPALGLDKVFDHIINSSDVGYLKNEYNGKTFVDCFNQYNITDTSRSYLLDDSDRNCKVFSKLGGKAIKINKKEDTINHLKIISEI